MKNDTAVSILTQWDFDKLYGMVTAILVLVVLLVAGFSMFWFCFDCCRSSSPRTRIDILSDESIYDHHFRVPRGHGRLIKAIQDVIFEIDRNLGKRIDKIEANTNTLTNVLAKILSASEAVKTNNSLSSANLNADMKETTFLVPQKHVPVVQMVQPVSLIRTSEPSVPSGPSGQITIQPAPVQVSVQPPPLHLAVIPGSSSQFAMESQAGICLPQVSPRQQQPEYIQALPRHHSSQSPPPDYYDSKYPERK